MSISVAMSRPLRAATRGTGRHVLPRGAAPAARAATRQDKPHQPKHAAAARQRDAA